MRRRKKSNTNLKIFILSVIVVLSIVSIIKYSNIFKDDNENNADNNITNNENKIDNNKKDDDTTNKNETSNIDKDNKDEQVNKNENNEFEKINYYKAENLNRYLEYQEKNKNYNTEKVVTYVNIGLDKEFYSFIKDADMSYGNLILMNKYNKLKEDYTPNDLEEIDSKYFINGNTKVRKLKKEAKEAFEMLSEDSINNGTPVYGQSAFRPYEMQESLYNNAVSNYGQKQADIDTARPGFSEHQTGLAIDVSSTKGGNMLYFDSSKSFEWMNENAHKYGFILRYEEDKTNITGFMYESWHYRYVGIKVATDMYENYPDLTYEEYYVRFIEK